MTAPAATPFIGPAELADRWQVNRKTVLDSIHRGEIPCTRLGKRWLIPLAWVEAEERRSALVEKRPSARQRRIRLRRPRRRRAASPRSPRLSMRGLLDEHEGLWRAVLVCWIGELAGGTQASPWFEEPAEAQRWLREARARAADGYRHPGCPRPGTLGTVSLVDETGTIVETRWDDGSTSADTTCGPAAEVDRAAAYEALRRRFPPPPPATAPAAAPEPQRAGAVPEWWSMLAELDGPCGWAGRSGESEGIPTHWEPPLVDVHANLLDEAASRENDTPAAYTRRRVAGEW
jgi:excisionase family DNA binding protein